MTIAWTDELEQRIISGLACSSLGKLCKAQQDLPSQDSIERRMAANEDFAVKCARARRIHAMNLLEKSRDALYDADPDSLTQPAVRLLELKIGDAHWNAERLLAKEYGNKLQVDGEIGIKTLVVVADAKQLAARPEAKPAFEAQQQPLLEADSAGE
jgi:hypothetical protein